MTIELKEGLPHPDFLVGRNVEFILPLDQVPWITSRCKTIKLNGVEIETSSGQKFLLGSVVKFHHKLSAIASAIKPEDSRVINNIHYKTVHDYAVNGKMPPKLQKGLCGNIFYAKRDGGERAFFIDTTLETTNGEKTRAFITVAVCGSKNDEPGVTSILTGCRGKRK